MDEPSRVFDNFLTWLADTINRRSLYGERCDWLSMRAITNANRQIMNHVDRV